MNTFEKFITDKNWKPYEKHMAEYSNFLDKKLSIALKHEVKQRKELRKTLQRLYGIKTFNKKLVKKLQKDLYSGNVVGVDGTCSDVNLLSGFQARIGIVSVNYKNNKATYTATISEPFLNIDTKDIKKQMKYLKLKGSGKIGISSSHIRAIMLYKERELVFERKEKYKMVQGDILPYEMRTGQGKLRGLNACLKLGKKLLNEDFIVAVQSSTKKPELRWVGTALNSGEYVEMYDYHKMLEAFLKGDDVQTERAHFNKKDEEVFKEFNSDVKGKFSIGIYKVKERAYVYYAPRANFDLMTNLIFADSQYQSLRGFPLLLDYADIICSKIFAMNDFRKIINTKLAKLKRYEFEIDERSLRRR